MKDNFRTFHMYVRIKREARERLGLFRDQSDNLYVEPVDVG